jgi:hypothetical protein
MKKVIAVGVLLASVLFTFQPAATADVPVVEPVVSVETVITAPVVELPVVEPVVTTEAAPTPEPVVEVAPVVPVPVPAATATATAMAQPVSEPVAPAETVVAPSVAVTEPEPAPVCYEDMPCWDCSTMGNRICGLDEAFALSGYADFGTFRNAYLGTYPVYTPSIGFRAVVSVINPAFQYVFAMTTPEICASLKLGDAWAGVGLTCGTPEVPAPVKGVTPEAPVIIPPHAEPGVEPEA